MFCITAICIDHNYITITSHDFQQQNVFNDQIAYITITLYYSYDYIILMIEMSAGIFFLTDELT